MKGTKFVRFMAFVLSMTMLLSGAVVVAAAADNGTSGGSSLTDTSLAGIKELLNAISYGEYMAEWFDKVQPGTQTIEIDVLNAVYDEDAGFEVRTQDGEEVLFTPADGAATWKVNVPEDGRYSLKIEYYPDRNKAASIERTLSVDGKVPFSEARYLTLPKYWVNAYDEYFDAPDGMTLDSFCAAAVEAGFADAVVEDAHLATGDVVPMVKIPYPSAWTSAKVEFAETYGLRYFQTDYLNNELRPSTVDQPEFMTFYLKDSSGFYMENFELAFLAGEHELTLTGRNEPMSIKSITLVPAESVRTYAEYQELLKNKWGVDVTQAGTDTVKLEAEAPSAMSNKTIYPIEDRSCAINSPTDPTRSVLNTVGGEKWATIGQWVEYSFSVNSSGMYDIVSRFRQNVLDGMFTCRAMYLTSEGLDEDAVGYYNGAPFAEALRLAYDYSDNWQVTTLSDGRIDTNGDGVVDGDDDYSHYAVYLEKDVVYTMRVEVSLGKMGDIIRQVQDTVTTINSAYLRIIQLTGTSPDANRDYGFSEIMPDVMVDMVIQSRVLYALADQLEALAGTKSSNVGTLTTVARLLKKMGTDEDEIAGNLVSLKDNIGTLGTFLSDAQTQPLQLDFIQIQPLEADMPAANPSFFASLWHEIVGFFQSFTRDYNNMGALEETADGTLTVWMATARDQFQITRNLINYGYTGRNNIPVDLKLIAGGTLLPSILAGSGPDVSMSMAQGDVINYAIRSAIMSIEDVGLVEGETDAMAELSKLGYLNFKDYALEYQVDDSFNTVYDANGKVIIDNPDAAFNAAAMVVLGIADADEQMHYYGVPETQAFAMMFVRTDVLASLDLDVPKTWGELLSCIPVLQANSMEIGLPTDSKIWLYQQGGDLFADEGMRINLDSSLALASFDYMCNLFTMYSFPYVYNAANRFRTGEMPIILGPYVETYNQLKVFATEIEGKWSFVPLPGEVDQKTGEINNVSISTVTATVMVKGCEDRVRAWSFMQWYTGEECQVDFSNEMVAIMGPSAKQSVANRHALASMPWTTDELKELQAQFENLASVPNYPGAYIVDRYTNFAFVNAYTANEDPATAMLAYINAINKEINRKRLEFDLETLSDGDVTYKNLMEKRIAQIEWLVGEVKNSGDASAYTALMEQVLRAIRSEDDVEIAQAAAAVWAAYEAIPNSAEIYEKDRNAVMGYDVNDKKLTKDDREDLRKCFIYEVYKNTDKTVTRLYCMADFLNDVHTLLGQ